MLATLGQPLLLRAGSPRPLMPGIRTGGVSPAACKGFPETLQKSHCTCALPTQPFLSSSMSLVGVCVLFPSPGFAPAQLGSGIASLCLQNSCRLWLSYSISLLSLLPPLGFYPFQETYFWYFHEHLASCESKNIPTPSSPAVYLMFSNWAWSLLQCGVSLGMFSPPPATLPCSFLCFLDCRFILKFLLMSLPLVHI